MFAKFSTTAHRDRVSDGELTTARTLVDHPRPDLVIDDFDDDPFWNVCELAVQRQPEVGPDIVTILGYKPGFVGMNLVDLSNGQLLGTVTDEGGIIRCDQGALESSSKVFSKYREYVSADRLAELAICPDLPETLDRARSCGVFDSFQLSSGDRRFAEIFFNENGDIRPYRVRAALAEALGKVNRSLCPSEDIRTPFSELVERVRYELMHSDSIISKKLSREMVRL